MSFDVQVAQRSGSRLLIQASGVSGSGKTLSALLLAYGLTGGDGNKIVGIDTENRRMSLNASESLYRMVQDQLGLSALPSPFKTLDFYAPFSPDRYIEAIDAACNAGAEVIVIDSVTHEWESEGGCEWIASQSRFPDWKQAKRLHKRFMTHMLQCPAHIIACTRAREKTDFTDPKNPRSLGIQPIQEKNFSFEATASLLMHDQGKRQDVLKCPAELQAVLGRGQGYITAADGAALRTWVDGGVAVDPAVEHHRGMLLNACEGGMAALQTAWGSVPAAIKKKIGGTSGCPDSLKASAKAFDDQRKAAADAGVVPENAALGALNAAAATVAATPTAQAPAAPAQADPPAQAQPDDGDIF